LRDEIATKSGQYLKGKCRREAARLPVDEDEISFLTVVETKYLFHLFDIAGY
jgi:hypothetical protein